MTPDSQLQAELLDAIWQAIDRLPMVQSATVAGSFASASPLEAVSDIDLIAIADPLNVATFSEISGTLTESLRVPLDRRGWELLVNSTLGPLKFDRPRRAVLHLMLYSPEAHRQHVLNSPFTCLDWQRSPLWRKAPLADVYPCFGLQPRHFLSKRRSVADYLHDLAAESVSYRELEFTADGYREIPRRQPMAERDRVEFAWHIVKFVMQNFVKLVRRTNEALGGDVLLDAYLDLFPAERNEVAGLYRELAARRTNPVAYSASELVARVRQFLASFERQFRDAFETRATRHYFLRHAPTALNGRTGGERLFLGRTDAPLDPAAAAELAEFVALPELPPGVKAFASPLMRTRQTLELLGRHWPLPKGSVTVDARLLEIDYGRCEGLTVAQTSRQFSELFEAWRHGDDPCFPGGECTADVAERLESFLGEHITAKAPPSVVCTHNVVLRCLVGELLGVPRRSWHRLAIGHVEPIEVVATERFGRFVNLTPQAEQSIFALFAGAAAHASA